MANMTSDKPVNTVVLDTGAIIKNEPAVSTLLSQAETLVTVPAIISEIKDAATRSRVETTLKPFLTIRSPNPNSIKFVTDFARRTGDLAVLSKADIQIIALTYEIECERNGGDWRLRRVPGQKGVNGAPPSRAEAKAESSADLTTDAVPKVEIKPEDEPADASIAVPEQNNEGNDQEAAIGRSSDEGAESTSPYDSVAQVTSSLETTVLDPEDDRSQEKAESKVDLALSSTEDQAVSDTDSDSDGWITPSNLKKKQAADVGASTVQTPEPKTMQVAVLTSDFAMQNVILQINLNLLSPSMTRIKQLRTYVLRCHACFCVHKDLSKQFCSRCGQPSLTRVSCSTSANGEFKLHLKKNMQWNTRGDRYSIPKPVHGSTNGRIHGGGKGGWGNELILAEDQKEYARASAVEKRHKERSLMDEDYLPSILTGDRNRAGGRTRVGAGRNVNSRKR
ncbi:hypothetical protein DOTSEDRAFT_53814 [Dothistroma septosporum NZE10]|uniref:20S-pre-rRNA D-site endonuclease NOB1 n=1 Tax=Dothistroma septosporum (strain NZE10 / CBS 128990) TaxID=675120 RepID=M2YLL6_DOTSN|nr:hypothetical protein DOTSEDRAFT_53814 [Dothistroma septosporum NZE10]